MVAWLFKKPRVLDANSSRPRLKISLYEGNHTYRLQRSVSDFVPMCVKDKRYGVSASYVRGAFDKNKASAPDVTFAMIGRDVDTGRPIAFIKCTLYNKLDGCPVGRVVVVDLVCGSVAGAGGALLDETLHYSQNVLGANLIVLQALTDPATIRAYERKKFARGLAPTDDKSMPSKKAFRILLDTMARQPRKKDLVEALMRCTTHAACQAMLLKNLKGQSARDVVHATGSGYMNRLQQRWYPSWNVLGESVVMHRTLKPPFRAAQPRVVWKGVHGTYKQPIVHSAMAWYRPVTKKTASGLSRFYTASNR